MEVGVPLINPPFGFQKTNSLEAAASLVDMKYFMTLCSFLLAEFVSSVFAASGKPHQETRMVGKSFQTKAELF